MLEGKTILNTRPKSSNDQISIALKERGMNVVHYPLIEIVPSGIESGLIERKVKEGGFSWIVFTSSNGVDHFFDQFAQFSDISESINLAVFGKRTAESLSRRGIEATIVNQENSSADLLDDLCSTLNSEDRVLLVLGDQASGLLEQGLKNQVFVERINVYQTRPLSIQNSDLIQRIERDNYDLILFTSPTGYMSFKEQAGSKVTFKDLRIACLGPSTQKQLLNDGIRPCIVANPSGKEGLIAELENYFNRIEINI